MSRQLFLSRDWDNHHRTKRDLRYHYVRHAHDQSIIVLERISRAQQVADTLTKASTQVDLHKFRVSLLSE
jgi:hypothetical protein